MVGSPPRRNTFSTSTTTTSATLESKAPTTARETTRQMSTLSTEQKANLYAVFEEFFLRDPDAWKELTARSLDIDEEKTLVLALANLCYCHALGSAFITKVVIPYEISKTVSPALLLRGDTFSNKLLVEYGKLVSGRFFRKALKPVIQKLVAKNFYCEVDPNRLELGSKMSKSEIVPVKESKNVATSLRRSPSPEESAPDSHESAAKLIMSSSSPTLLTDIDQLRLSSDGEQTDSPSRPRRERGRTVLSELQSELESNRARLVSTALSIATSLNESLKEHFLSNNFRALCKAVHEESQKKFPNSNFTGMSGLLFLRYVCPYIVSPQQYDLVPKDVVVKSTTVRSLVLVAKLLQVAASQSTFDGEKELYMIPFNASFKDFNPVIISFYESILDSNSLSTSSKKEKRLEKMYSDPSLRISHTELIFNHLLRNTGIVEKGRTVNSHLPTDPLRSTLSFVQEGLLLIQPRVNLSGLGLTQQEATALAKKLQGNTTVTELDLSDNAIGGEGIRSLAQTLLAQNKSIIKLDLRKNHISSDDILHISKAIKGNTTLQELLLDVDFTSDPNAESLCSAIEAITKANRELDRKGSGIRRGRIASFTKSMLNSL
eukprot:TRINITY_DN2500_c0_g1_i1.p1 TRINITY_DN2500_c0_g1~~TRINITY_DN2500_c0_g1_i1.p1  ORF type:complete len:604 (-),score=117.80 TRINITY_DN2500_c0_g1_i1:205-2016(-)